MFVDVKPDTERLIAEQIQLGHFASPEDVIEAAVTDLVSADSTTHSMNRTSPRFMTLRRKLTAEKGWIWRLPKPKC